MSEKSSAAKGAPLASTRLPPHWAEWEANSKGPPSCDATVEPARASDRAFIEHEPVLAKDVPHIWEYPANDDGNAAFFLAHFRNVLRYVPEFKQWRIWYGHRWHIDNSGRARYYCQFLSRVELMAAADLRKEGAAKLAAEIAAGDEEAQKKPGRKLKRADVEREADYAKSRACALGNEKVITSLLNAAACDGRIVIPAEQWDADPWLVGTVNGTLNLRTRTHRQGRPGDYITKELAVSYEPGAQAPQWIQFIARILPEAVASYVQKLAGYSLTGFTDDKAFYFLYGSGTNGKTILIETLAGIFHHYAGHAPRNLIEESKHGAGCKNEIANLPGVRFLHGEETGEGAKLREELVKSLTGAVDTMTGEKKYLDEFSFRPDAKLWVMGNHKPKVTGTDHAIWNRMRLIPFTAKISEEERIESTVLMARLSAERPGILNWMLAGLAACPSLIIPAPAVVKEATAEYRQEEDILGDFVEECTQDAADGYKEPKQALFAAYQKWARENGIVYAWPAKQFTRRLGERAGWKMDPGHRAWIGKSVRTDYASN